MYGGTVGGGCPDSPINHGRLFGRLSLKALLTPPEEDRSKVHIDFRGAVVLLFRPRSFFCVVALSLVVVDIVASITRGTSAVTYRRCRIPQDMIYVLCLQARRYHKTRDLYSDTNVKYC